LLNGKSDESITKVRLPRHFPAAYQWLYVVSGEGEAVVNGEGHPLREGALLLIEASDLHEVRNTGEEPLRILNVYVPPLYTEDGEELPAGEK
jgi:mannose-6-phosphate isomerase-like protein (cupin superfamily)